MPIRKSSAIWEGTLKEGKGRIRLGSGAFEGPYSFSSRFEEGAGTNPEELIAGAHAGCFSMALAGGLAKAGFPPRRIATTAQVTIESTPGGFRITRIDLFTEAAVPEIEAKLFAEQAEHAKKNCPVSQALAATMITLQANLLS
jgi:osmotically inducible protein OsmC